MKRPVFTPSAGGDVLLEKLRFLATMPDFTLPPDADGQAPLHHDEEDYDESDTDDRGPCALTYGDLRELVRRLERVETFVRQIHHPDLVVWTIARVVDLRRQGERATFRVTWKKTPGLTVYSLDVRRADGTIERPIFPYPLFHASGSTDAGPGGDP